MSVKRFKFVSPGVFLNEIDNSQLPKTPEAVGPTVVGRLEKGPGLIPLTVQNMSQFIEIFGNPIPGGQGEDVWREGNKTAPTYAAYAAQAYLRNSGPVNVVRLLGVEDPQAATGGEAGWTLDGATANGNNPAADQSSAYGLYLFSTGGVDSRGNWKGGDSTKSTKTQITGTLAAIWYFQKGAIALSGTLGRLSSTQTENATISGSLKLGDGQASTTIQVANGTAATGMTELEKITITDSAGTTVKYIFCDSTQGGAPANTAALSIGDDTGAFVATEAGTAVSMDPGASQNTFLVQLKAAIESAQGHNGTITVSAVPGAAAEAQSITITLANDAPISSIPTTDISQLTIPTDFTRKNVIAGAKVAVTGSGILVSSTDNSKMEFVAHLYDQSTVEKRIVFNFDRDSDKYIRKVFNTNPTLTNSDITSRGTKGYWLGETFDRFVRDTHGLGTIGAKNDRLHQGALSADKSLCAAVLPLLKETVPQYDHREANQDSVTGWVFSQDLNSSHTGYKPEKQQKLFKFIGISDGGYLASNVKISITDVKVGNDVDPYGTFTVLVRDVRDNDAAPIILESFTGCSLNPNSKNYIGVKIGDRYREWDETDKRYRVYGDNVNQSRFIRVKLQDDLNAGQADPQCLPFGFFGPIQPITGKIITKDHRPGTDSLSAEADGATSDPYVDFTTNAKSYKSLAIDKHGITGLPINATASLRYPTLPMRLTASEEGLSDPKKSFFGVSTYRSPTDVRFDPSYIDAVRRLGKTYVGAEESEAVTDKSESTFVFTCDDIIAIHRTGSTRANVGTRQKHLDKTTIGTAIYMSGSRAKGQSFTARKPGFTELVKSGFVKFTIPMFGGYDGLDITEKEAFRNTKMDNKDEQTSYEIASLKRALDAVTDPEIVEMNALAAPGITNTRVTNQMIRVCEERADALAIIDIERNGYIPTTEGKDSFKTRIQNSKVQEAVTRLDSRGINSSYACCFYPWVKINDQISEQLVWVPPSVVALGTFASTERESELWFAPAGFTRGGLSDGAGGLPVISVSQRVSSKERDELYEANINPIASFPAEGIVVFGQKTLQITPSALDRINVRRLMIFVKKEISRIAARLLFDQNVQATWDRFRGQVEPFLDSVKSRFGLTDFRVILDETTTTPDLIDRNIMYAKIFLKPARSIEFIAIDFVITNTGASFED